MFTQHTLESAPPGSRPLMEKVGHRSTSVARLAESPELLGGFLQANALFEATTLGPVDREVLVMTIATRNGCRVCISLHTARLRQFAAEPALIAALRNSEPLADPRLEALRVFTLRVLATAGEVPDDELTEFLAAGFTHRNALEVVLGIGTYTMSTLANRLVKA